MVVSCTELHTRSSERSPGLPKYRPLRVHCCCRVKVYVLCAKTGREGGLEMLNTEGFVITKLK